MTGRKWTLRDRLLVWVAGAIAPAVVRVLGATWRVSVTGDLAARTAISEGRNIIYALWHGQLLALGYAHRGRGICVLSSLHRDGEMNARLMSALGYEAARGSTTRGSAEGLAVMLAKLAGGHDLAIAPDGPRGPARVAQRGVFFLSERSGAPVVPLAAWARPARLLSSWDSFMIPLPFARVAIVYGEPVEPDPSSPAAARAEALEESLDRLTERARSIVAT